MLGTLKLKTAPTTTPVTRAEAMAHCRVVDEGESSYIASLIEAAKGYAERVTGRQLITATWYYYLSEFDGDIRVPLPPLQSVTAITYTDTAGASQTLTATTDYEVHTEEEPGLIVPAYGKLWPATYPMPNVIRIEFIAGYGAASAVPAEIKQAILEHIEIGYDLRGGEAQEGLYRGIDARLHGYKHGWAWT